MRSWGSSMAAENAPLDDPCLHVIVTWAGNGWWACDRCEELFRLVGGVHVPREEAIRG